MTSVPPLYNEIPVSYGIPLAARLYTMANFPCGWIAGKCNHGFVILFISFILIAQTNLNAQTTRKVLFLGNSYTSVNNLPKMVYDVALSAGDTLIYDSHTPAVVSLPLITSKYVGFSGS